MGLLVAAYVVRSLMAREVKEPVISTRNMPTPVVDLPIGTEITEKHLGTAPIRTDELTSDMLANKAIIIGRVVREPLKKAQPVKANQLYAPGERPLLVIAKGQRALSLPFDGVTTIVDGLIRPGDHCDVRFTLNPSYLRSDARTSHAFQMTLFKAIKVLAINRNVVQQQPDNLINTVTLDVTSKQANALLLAKAYGTLNLTYTEDLTPGGVEIGDEFGERLTVEKLLGLPEDKGPQKPPRPPEPYRIDTYRGTGHGVMGFNEKGRAVGTGYGWPGDQYRQNRDPGNPDLYDAPGTDATWGGPSARAPGAKKSAGNGAPDAAPANDDATAWNDGNSATPTQMATQTRYAHQRQGQSMNARGNSNDAGGTNQAGNNRNASQANDPQFYGQSAPGQVTGPGYSVPPGFTPGVYGNVPYFSAQ